MVVMKHPDQGQLEDERVYFTYTPTAQSIFEGNQSRNLEAGTDAGLLPKCATHSWEGFPTSMGQLFRRWSLFRGFQFVASCHGN